MLNSRYAPVVAITAVVILIVIALGWFLAISPKLDEAGDLRDRAATIDTNTAEIQMQTARLAQYEAELAEVPNYQDLVALNAPAVYDVEATRDRLSDAGTQAGVYIYETSAGGVQNVLGAEVDHALLPSTAIARLFATGPVDVAEGEEEFAPVLTPSVEEGPVVERLYGIPLTFTATGSVADMMDFLALLTDEQAAALQIDSLAWSARPPDEPIAGVPDGEPGDVILEGQGYIYLLDPDMEIVDEDALTDASLPSVSPFTDIAGSATGGDEEEED